MHNRLWSRFIFCGRTCSHYGICNGNTGTIFKVDLTWKFSLSCFCFGWWPWRLCVKCTRRPFCSDRNPVRVREKGWNKVESIASACGAYFVISFRAADWDSLVWSDWHKKKKKINVTPPSLINYHHMLLHHCHQYKTEVNLTGLGVEVWVWVE